MKEREKENDCDIIKHIGSLPHKCEALSSNPSTPPQKKERIWSLLLDLDRALKPLDLLCTRDVRRCSNV
jgi:hypothetical protein